jgi:acyl dehydratase
MAGDTFDLSALGGAVGCEVVSSWVVVSQDTVDRFAEVSDDRQWIHVDRARALVESPWGTTVAHGFLTLSLISRLLREAVSISGVRVAINYGLNRVRFPSPLPSGTRVRGRFRLGAVDPIEGGVQVTWMASVEKEHGDKPCCAAEWLVRYLA